MSAETMPCLPLELVREVHGYLCSSSNNDVCALDDHGASLRASCKQYYELLRSQAPACADCASLQQVCHFKYEEVCRRLAFPGCAYASTTVPHCSQTCVFHDGFHADVDAEVRRECMRALKSLSKQVLLGKKALSFHFENWSSVDMFQGMLSRLKVKLSPKFRPVVTRAARGLRVSWIESRLPKYYPLVSFNASDNLEKSGKTKNT